MKSIQVFFDTEFSDCDRADPQIISIGFVVDQEKPHEDLYIELSDGWSKDAVSPFVTETVLPLLGRYYPELLRRSAAAARIEQYFDELRNGDRAVSIELASDSEWDWVMLCSLYEPRWPSHFNATFKVRPFTELQESLITEYFEVNGLEADRHHALIDARALAYAVAKIDELMSREDID